MSPKELNYIEDALGHEQFLMNQCQEAIQNLQDPALKIRHSRWNRSTSRFLTVFIISYKEEAVNG